MKIQLKRTPLSIAVAQAALICGAAYAQGTPPAQDSGADQATQTIVVSAQRAAMRSAAELKQRAEEIVDGVVAEEAGKLPDKSITEVLQRVVGVTMDRNRSRGDPEHFSVEGSGISVRGLTWGSSTLNGRESFSAGWPGRELSWGDVPAELMSAVIVHKNPPAELVEGGVSGQVDLRTALPFDYKGDRFSASTYANYNQLGAKSSPALSGLVSKRWENSFGQWGALLDLSANESNSHNDTVQVDAYYPRTGSAGQTVWIPKSASWRTNTGTTDRVGAYGALQWRKGGLESSMTYFHSAYKEYGNENALYTGIENPYKTELVNPVFDSNGVLQSGKYTYPLGGLGANNFAAGGLGFSSNQTFSERKAQTRELAWNVKWTINDHWSIQNDLQWVHATDKSFGGNMTLGTFVPSMDVDLTSTPARITFDATATKFLSNPANYYLQTMMPSMGKSDADLYAWKTDARYKFNDAVMRDLRFGVRLTKRATNHIDASGSGWYSPSEPWAVKQTSIPGQLPNSTDQPGWAPRANFGYLSDPRYAAVVPTTTYDFKNFFNGKIGVPATVVVPTMAMVKGYPATYAAAAQLLKLECQDGNAHFGTNNDCSTAGDNWMPLSYDGDPAKTRRQGEKTQAAYLSTRFGFDELRFPVEGSAGVRVVRTQSTAHGYSVFKPSYGNDSPPEVPHFGTIDEPITAERTYIDVLPSLNLKVDLTDKVQARFAFGKSMYRPGFGDLSEYITVSQNVTNGDGNTVKNITYLGSNSGNINLKPTKANSFDMTLEWYPGDGTSLTGALFYKQVRDIIMRSAYTRSYNDLEGNAQNFLISAPNNEADGSVAGLELAGQSYFDHLPGLRGVLPAWTQGFGVSANYTYIKSKQTLHHPFDLKYCPANGSFNNSSLNLYGCDTNGLPFTSMPLQYLSRNAYNLALMYDKGPLSARLAYSWRSRYLQGVSVNGTQGSDATSSDPTRATVDQSGKTVYPQDVGWGLPTWQEATGQLDFGFDYKFSEHLQGSFSANNLADVIIRQTQQQTVGNMTRAWFEPGRSYRLALRYTY